MLCVLGIQVLHMTVRNSYLTYSFQKAEANENLQHFLYDITVRCHAWCGKPVSLFDGVVRGRALLLQLQLNWLHYASWVVGWTALRWVCQSRPGSWVRHCPEDWSEVPGTWFTGNYSRTCKDFSSWKEAFHFFGKCHLLHARTFRFAEETIKFWRSCMRNLYCFYVSPAIGSYTNSMSRVVTRTVLEWRFGYQ